MEIIYLKPSELKPYKKNAKKHPPEQVQHIANSIREFGFRQPIVIDKNNVIVIGHGRLMAAKELMLETVPCVRVEDLTEEQIKALRLADNKTNESEWDFPELEVEIAELELDGFDMSDFGFVDIPGEVSEGTEKPEVKLEEKFQLIVDCEDETDMQEKYDVLQEAGIECRVSTL